MKKEIIGIFVCMLLAGVSVFSNVASKEVLNLSYGIEDNSENKIWDDTEEIVTFIEGNIYIEEYEAEIGIVRKVELWTTGYVNTYLEISGYKKPLFPFNESFFTAEPQHIIANRFFGMLFQWDRVYVSVRGIAFGNIEWSIE